MATSPMPYTFGTATAAIPLSQLDTNFATPITLGNTSVYLNNTYSSIGNLTLANVTITSGTVTITNVAVTTANVSGTANISTLVVVGNETVGGNTTITGNITAANANVTTNLVLSGGTANGVAYLNTSKVLTTGSALTYNGTDLAISGKITSTVANNASYQIAGAFTNATNADFLVQLKTNYTQIGPSTLTPLALAIGGTEKVTIGAATGGVGAVGIGYTSLTSVGDNGLAVLGNVGIGTSSPSGIGKALNVYGGAGDVSTVIAEGDAGAKFLALYSGSASNDNGAIYSNQAIRFGYATSKAAAGYTNLMQLTTSGNLGLGVTPSGWTTYKALQVGSGYSAWSTGVTNSRMFANTYYDGSYKYVGTGRATQYEQDGYHAWYNAPSWNGTGSDIITFTQAMTLNANGQWLLNTTTPIYSNADAAHIYGKVSSTNQYGLMIGGDASAYTCYGLRFLSNNSGSIVGTVTFTTTATAYNTSSDYRLKNTIAPMTGALAKVAALKPVTYKWNSDNSDGEGFIAHELAEVCPQAVTGEKDAVDDEGKPVYQGIDTSFLVATLTAAIQELKAEFDAYKASHP